MKVPAPARNGRTFVATEKVLSAVLAIGLSLLGWPLPAEGAPEESVGPLPVMPGGVAKQALDLSIEHTPLQCVVPTERPKIEAKALPGVNLGNGYVFYRATGTKSFYYVFLDRGVGDGMSGVLPRPEPTTKSIDYYLQALNRQRLKTETARYKPPVVKDESSCQREPGAGRTETARPRVAPKPAPSGALASKQEPEKKLEGLTIGLTEAGQDPVPPGFKMEDIGRVILVTGAIVTLSVALGIGGTASAAGGAAGTATAAGGGSAATGTAAAGGAAAGGGAAGAAGAAGGAVAAAGGISAGVLVGAGVVVVGAGVAVAAGGGGSSDPTPTVSLTATPASGTAPLSVTMTANVSSGTSPYTYGWDFGDGQTTSGSSTQIHTYRNPSNTPYSAKVTVTDSKGKTASDSKSITVSGPAPLSFLEVDVSYSGPGNVALTLNLSGQSVGTAYPTSCGPTGNRTARVIVSQPGNGSYTVTATGSTCAGQSSVGSISAVFTALTNAGSMSACSAVFKDVPVGSTTTACTFSIP